MLEKFRSIFFKNLAIGFLALIPIFATFYVFVALLNFSDNFLFNLLPSPLQPQNLLGVRIPGLGILLTLTIICSTGVLMRNFLGKRAFLWVEEMIRRIPLVNTLYNAFRQLTESIFMNRSNAFRKVVLIEFPTRGVYTVAFVTHSHPNTNPAIKDYQELYSVFVPTTPNPTSGFFMFVPDYAVRDVHLTVQEAFRLIVSVGLITGSASEIMLQIEEALVPMMAKRREEYP